MYITFVQPTNCVKQSKKSGNEVNTLSAASQLQCTSHVAVVAVHECGFKLLCATYFALADMSPSDFPLFRYLN